MRQVAFCGFVYGKNKLLILKQPKSVWQVALKIVVAPTILFMQAKLRFKENDFFMLQKNQTNS